MLRPMMIQLTPANARRLVALSQCDGLAVTVTDEIKAVAKTGLVNPEDFGEALRDPVSLSVIQKLIDADMRAVVLVDDGRAAINTAIKIITACVFQQRLQHVCFFAHDVRHPHYWENLVSDLGEHDPVQFTFIQSGGLFEEAAAPSPTDEARGGLLMVDMTRECTPGEITMDFPKSIVIATEQTAMMAVRHLHWTIPERADGSVYQHLHKRARFMIDRRVRTAMNIIDDLAV